MKIVKESKKGEFKFCNDIWCEADECADFFENGTNKIVAVLKDSGTDKSKIYRIEIILKDWMG